MSENNNPENMGDLHEGFDWGYEDLELAAANAASEKESAMSGANQWPAEVKGFREACLSY